MMMGAAADKLGGAAFNKGGQFDLTGNSQSANAMQLDYLKQQLDARTKVGQLATVAAHDPAKQATYAEDRAKILAQPKVRVPDENGNLTDIGTFKKNSMLKANEGKTLTDANGSMVMIKNGKPVPGKMVNGSFVADGQ